MEKRFTAAEVTAVRMRAGFDDRAMQLQGVVGVGTAGHKTDSWIRVLCVDEAALGQAQEALGTTIEGVPIRFEVSGVIRAR